ncbi:MAG TPA: metalloregulator ArsR/SmtB family transcription factor [Dongiaceae bacterium]|nr:metalloregulator ArsR/SmtB family transcription factor [Dongiaceae bacterium]
MSMDAVFRALADPVRRALLDRLHARNGQTLGELCEGHDMTRQAVAKHLAVLEDAKLVVSQRRGREKLHYLNPVPIHEIADRWIGKYEHSRLRALSELKERLERSTTGKARVPARTRGDKR